MSKRPICPNCERPVKTCLCSELVHLQCNYQVIILQDPKESKHALSSAPILAKSIIGTQLFVGEKFNPDEILGKDWQQNSLLVFPQENNLTSTEAAKDNFKYLILLDGTWRKVSRLIHLNPWLSEIPSISINNNNSSEYLIRKSPREDGLSTIEAAVCILNDLHNSTTYTPILSAFNKMINFQIKAMGNDTFQKNYTMKKS